MAKKMPTSLFVSELYAAYKRKDGYIMGATGQNPKKWAVNSWWFNQYKDHPKQYKQALYWREHAARVWDCNGLAEGLYKDYSGVDINTKARYNYQQWCDPKGKGMIPAKYRVPGAAVFWGDTASNIHHVAYLYKPVDANKPSGDWYLIEARGVMYGVVKTKLLDRKPNFWGLMTKYFDYDQKAETSEDSPAVGDRILRNGMEGEDVKALQTNLIRLGYSCGKWGADGDFGSETETAVKKFQSDKGLPVNGIVDTDDYDALFAALGRYVEITGQSVNVRSAPSLAAREIGTVHMGERLPYGGVTNTDDRGIPWYLVDYHNENGWVSGKLSKIVG